MANRYLIASGDSENPAIYDGGTLPAANDVLRLNGFVWTVTSNRTIAELRTDALAPAVATSAARSVVINNGVTLTATNLVQGITGSGATGLLRTQSASEGTVVSQLFTRCVCGVTTGERINIIGNGDPSGAGANSGLIRGAGIVNWVGNILPGVFYVQIDGGVVNLAGNLNNSSFAFLSTTASVSITGVIESSATLLDQTSAVAIPFTHNGPLIATGANPVIRSKSLYYGTGPFINNGEVMALSCDRVRLLGTDNQWSMIKADGSAQVLRTAGLLTGYPLESKVEDGTVYGPSNEFEGTLLPWDATFAQALATAQRDLQLPSILSAITQP